MEPPRGETKKKRVITHKIDDSTICSVVFCTGIGVLAVAIVWSLLASLPATPPRDMHPDMFYGRGIVFNTTTVQPIRDIRICSSPSVKFNEDGTYSVCVLSPGSVLELMEQVGFRDRRYI